MFDTRKFGGYLARLRKRADMTQSELADKLNLTRQAISRYELGDSFPDVSILVLIADIFGVTLDQLISSGEPSRGEALILSSVAQGLDCHTAENMSDVVNLAPYLKPSVLEKLSEGLGKQGIDISNIVSLANYLNDESVLRLLEKASFDGVDTGLLEVLMPMLDVRSKIHIFAKILDGEIDWHLIKSLVVFGDMASSPIEAAVIEGALPWEALDLMREGFYELSEKRKRENDL